MNEPLISTRDLSVNYGDHEALKNVTLDIYHYDFVGITGPNGGGKTTLVKAILGTVPFRGNIALRLDKSRIGYLPQVNDLDVNFPISVCEVVMSGLQSRDKMVLGYGKKEVARAKELLDMAGIKGVSHNQIGSVSGGQLQRALLCRALISDPQLLILDEPANFVDSRFETELYAMLRELNRRMAIIMISHDMEAVRSVAKTVVHVDKFLRPAQ